MVGAFHGPDDDFRKVFGAIHLRHSKGMYGDPKASRFLLDQVRDSLVVIAKAKLFADHQESIARCDTRAIDQ